MHVSSKRFLKEHRELNISENLRKYDFGGSKVAIP
jgi:hypothetical protein